MRGDIICRNAHNHLMENDFCLLACVPLLWCSCRSADLVGSRPCRGEEWWSGGTLVGAKRRALTRPGTLTLLRQSAHCTKLAIHLLLLLYTCVQPRKRNPPYIIKAKQAQVIYDALAIRKEQIHKKQAWENL